MWLQLDELLQPLPDGSSGENLRYTPIHERIKEARREDEDDAPRGHWEQERKRADVPTVLQLATEALASKSKDLELAVWLGEAMLRRDGFAAITRCLQFLYRLQENFWETLYPELDEGSPEFRATHLEWFANRCNYLLRRTPLTKNKLDWLKYQESRSVGYEQDASENKEKLAQRESAIEENKITAEEFDRGFKATPKSFYVESCHQIQTAQEAARNLQVFCDQKYGNVSPSFSGLHKVLQDLALALDALLAMKRKLEPDEEAPGSGEATTVAEAETTQGEAGNGMREAAIAARVSGHTDPALTAAPDFDGTPSLPEKAFAVIARLAGHLRQQNPSSAVPYLLGRAIRWGELRCCDDVPDPALLIAPSTELRQRLKQLHTECEWTDLQEEAEAAVFSPCGRGWLDLQRYAWQACEQLSLHAPARAICSEVRGLLTDFPSFPSWMLTDDTPVATRETHAWLTEHVLPPPPPEPELVVPPLAPNAVSSNGSKEQFEAAARLAKSGRIAEGMDLLNSHPFHENAGRERFLRQLRIAQLCLTTGHYAIAYPILQNLYDEIQRRDLVEWEGPNFVVQLLTLLVQCIDKTSQDVRERAQIYNLLCRLEPVVALQMQK